MKHIEIIIGGRYEVVDEQGTRHSVEVLRDNGDETLEEKERTIKILMEK